MRKRKSLPAIQYEEGDLFAVPLRQGGFGLCLVARKSADGITVGYFFGPRFEKPPSLRDLSTLEQNKAYLVARFGDLGIIDGTWMPIGRLPAFNRVGWPVPIFGRTDALEEEGWKVFYDDDGTFVGEESISVRAAKALPVSDLFGSGAIEIVLSKLLSSN
jgi:Immunity protein 26